MRFLFLILLSLTQLLSSYLELDGVVESQNEKIISSRVMGNITKVYVNEGDIVKKLSFYMRLTQQILNIMNK